MGRKASNIILARTPPAAPSPRARPFIKWVGGKRQLLPDLIARMPRDAKTTRTYFEPFLGGGALFFHSAPTRAVLSDTNHRLIRSYLGVRDDVEGVISLLHTYPYDKDFFLELRRKDIDATKSNAEVAAWFIYLNKAGFNGLYRVNRANGFNVPFGRYTNPTICDEPNLRACSNALANVTILHAGFERVLKTAKKGDFVYFDPPYVPLSATSSFTSYTADGFGMEAQRRLRDVALDLKSSGVRVLLSNSSAPAVLELYGSGFDVRQVRALRNVNSKADARGAVSELLIS